MTRAATGPAPGRRRRVRIRITGTVQGVGFRPYVFRLASSLGLGGQVRNDERGVVCEVEGDPKRVDEFLARVGAEAPPLAAVEGVAAQETAASGELGFEILPSERSGEPRAPVSPDVATCEECLGELFDPGERRYRYPFVNCTNCGPRFTIVRGVPYDRALTTMAAFEMCPLCRAEYEDPGDRRFHAEPNACPACGPRTLLTDRRGRELDLDEHRDPVEAAAARLRAGGVLAVKGIGGFHLACQASDEDAVTALRSRKHREDKPFALMAPSLEAARSLAELSPADVELLTGQERPIVVARRRREAPVADAVAPRSRELGVMLPYSPLHHLLLADATTTLVMTSGNVSDEPIAYEDDEALARLGEIADAFLLHDRPIETRTDDSVVRALEPGRHPGPLLLRRSRGFVPRSLELPLSTPPALGCGAELKSTFCLAKGDRAWVGPHIGDLTNYETLRSFGAGVAHFERLFAVRPEIVAHDLHPDYLSTSYALAREGVELVGVQHHHAHLAACLAEHGEAGPAIGAIYDGTGYGPDGTAWGGELLAGDLGDCERAGSLLRVPLPGGDAAVREPWRMACSWLAAAGERPDPPLPAALAAEVEPATWEAVCELARTRLSSPPTSSVGRLCDAVAAICGLRARINYEGQAAVELEAASRPAPGAPYPLALLQTPQDGAGGLVLDPRETVRAIARDAERGVGVERIGGRFHEALAQATATACWIEAERRGCDLVALAGGVFQNRLLVERVGTLLRERGLRFLVPARLPPNDGGIAFGQVAVAAARGKRDAPRPAT